MEWKKRVRVGIQVDRISDLPDTVLHHILSFLPLKDVAQTCVLSKRWLHVWHTYPILDFSPYSFGFGLQSFFLPLRDRKNDSRYTKYFKTLEKYTNFIDYKLQNYCNHNLGIQKFNLSIICQPKLYPLIDKWIGLLREKHVKQLKLSLFTNRTDQRKVSCCYRSAQKVFGIKSLTELFIRSVETVLQSAIKHNSLVTLSLDQVCFDEMLIFDDQNLPCIRFISLSRCSIPGGVKISCHQLQELKLLSCRKLDKIKVIAPKLSLMSFSSRVTDRPSFFSLYAPSKLLSLRLSSTFSRFDGLWSHDLHPLLSGSRLSSTFLRFDASWLHILNPLLPGVRLFSTFSRLDASWSYNLHTSWFVKVKEFVLQMQNQTETLDLSFFPSEKLQNTFDRREASRRCRSPPYALKCLFLELRSSKILDYAALMEGLFWSFRPEILSVSCTYLQEGRDGCLLEFLCKMFEGKEDGDGGASKCWWQWSILEVKDIIVKDSKGIKQEVPLCWDALSKAIQIIQKIGQPKCSVNFYLAWR